MSFIRKEFNQVISVGDRCMEWVWANQGVFLRVPMDCIPFSLPHWMSGGELLYLWVLKTDL